MSTIATSYPNTTGLPVRSFRLRGGIGFRPEAYRSLVRVSAIYDLFVTTPFVSPWTFTITLGAIQYLHDVVGLPGGLPVFESTHLLFGGLMGSVVVVWSLVRLHLGLPVLSRYDAVARMLFALWQIYVVANGGTPIILIFTVFEVAFGILQAMPIKRERSPEIGGSVPR